MITPAFHKARTSPLAAYETVYIRTIRPETDARGSFVAGEYLGSLEPQESRGYPRQASNTVKGICHRRARHLKDAGVRNSHV